MRESLLIVFNTIKVAMKKKSTLWITFVLPIILAVFMIIMNTSGGRDLKIGINNKDTGIISKKLIKYVEKRDRFKIVNLEEKEINNFISKEKVDCVIVIPQDFSEEVYNNNIKKIKIVSIKGAEVTGLLENYLNIYIDNLKIIGNLHKGDKKSFDEFYNKTENGILKLNVEKVKDKSREKELSYITIGMLLMFVLTSSSNISKFILEERKNKTYNRIATTPVSTKQYIFGNILCNFMFSLIQIIIVMIIVDKYVLKENLMGSKNLIIFLILIMFSIVAISLSIFIVTICKSSSEASNLSVIVTVLSTMIGGGFWEIKIMPKFMQNLASFTPQKWAIQAIFKINTGSNLKNIGINMLILILFASTFFIITVYKLKMENKTEEFI
ncbi:ABC transporter permease [Clostridium botulinum]|uniref:ABC transporter permease n=1 Tax=Clostridium botulinum TaxID=1491 RepID=UPI000D13D8F4|nr:ABC transporter permease [Clostridium botulinum]AVQ46049.1 ABC transporter permease [Clostridium botulinum]AVQ49666.1 ABC transporter permease [Clostridium botulinum]